MSAAIHVDDLAGDPQLENLLTRRIEGEAITSLTILDPTCGSGAFLFAALNILQPLYEACLNRMQAFLDESGKS